MNQPIKTTAIGLMSGTSLDGLDIAFCQFILDKGKWTFELLNSESIKYPDSLTIELKNALEFDEFQLMKLHNTLGKKFGQWTNEFIHKNKIKPDLIASHGHTIFHDPKNNYTLQIAYGNEICKLTKTETISDFRSTNVALNGQGAPLVPIGDKLLFDEYDLCLNLGGIANMSYSEKGKRLAYDICTCNMLLNHLANKEGLEFDDGGNLARTGNLISELLNVLNENMYYLSNGPKSIGLEWFNENIKSIIDKNNESTKDLLNTSCIHISNQISIAINKHSNRSKKVLITGGGAHNYFLIEKLKENINCEIIIPSNEIINYKEAIIFAFMGVLRKLNIDNVLSSVTGSSKNHSAGIIYWEPNL